MHICDALQSLDQRRGPSDRHCCSTKAFCTVSEVRPLDVQHAALCLSNLRKCAKFQLHPSAGSYRVTAAPKTAKSLLTEPIKTSLWVCPPFQMYAPLWRLKLRHGKCVYRQKFSTCISLGGLPLSCEEQRNLPFDGAARLSGPGSVVQEDCVHLGTCEGHIVVEKPAHVHRHTHLVLWKICIYRGTGP